MKRYFPLVVSLAVVVSSGCRGRWRDEDTVTQAVWSDDDSGQAYVVQRYQERHIFQIIETVTEHRGFAYEVFVQRGDGSGRRSLTGARPGQAGPDLYYMASQGGARKVVQLTSNPATQLVFNSEDFSCVVTANGRCEMVDDMTVKRMVWDAIPAAAEYFQSPESEGFGVIKFIAEDVEVLCMAEGHEPVCVELGCCC